MSHPFSKLKPLSPRGFYPNGVPFASPTAFAQTYEALLDLSVQNKVEAITFLDQWTELETIWNTERSIRRILLSQDTTNKEMEAAEVFVPSSFS